MAKGTMLLRRYQSFVAAHSSQMGLLTAKRLLVLPLVSIELVVDRFQGLKAREAFR
jgi:hypothetical protein